MHMLPKCWFPCEWKDMNMYLNSCMTESAWIDFEAWSWALQLSGTSTCQFIDDFFAWSAGKMFSSVLVTSYSCRVLHVVDLEGQRTNHWRALHSCLCSMAPPNSAVSFPGIPCSKFCSCVQALQSWCYSRSQLSDLCADLMMPPRATTVTLSFTKQ